MNLMFWKKDDGGLSGPREIPQPVGQEIVVKLQGDPDSIWHLKAVMLPREVDKDTSEVRVFDASQAASRKVMVKNYNSLAEHPELILYEGWYNKKRGNAEIKKR